VINIDIHFILFVLIPFHLVSLSNLLDPSIGLYSTSDSTLHVAPKGKVLKAWPYAIKANEAKGSPKERKVKKAAISQPYLYIA
jgi:hypothetical protein